MLNRLLRPETRYARRMARIARWDRPIEGALGRVAAWLSMLVVDHGIVRVVYANRARVAPEFWRSAQPTPRQVAWFAGRGGRTIVNLRGGREHGSWPLEREACQRHGIALVDFVVRSREAPERDAVAGAARFLDGLSYPILVHCKSGADRAGLFSALYLILREGATAAQARRQLSPRFGHFRFAKTGILDAFLDAYEREGEAAGLGFQRWAEEVYDPARVTASFRAGFWSSLAADRLLRRE